MTESPETTSLLEESLESMSGTGKCRICWRTSYVGDLISPCVCSGTQKYTHFECLKRWIVERDSANKEVCDVCQQQYQKIVVIQHEKTFSQWIREGDDMSSKVFSTVLLMAFFFYLINMGSIQFVISAGKISPIIRYVQLVLIILFALLFICTFIVAIYVFRTEFKEWQSSHMNTSVERTDDDERRSTVSSSTNYQSQSSTVSISDSETSDRQSNRSLIVNESTQQYGTI